MGFDQKDRKILLLGSGAMGREYCACLKAMGLGDVTVVCNRAASAEKVKNDFGFTCLDGGYLKRLPQLKGSFDLVIICLPIAALLDGLAAMLSSGHRVILVEKPVALSSATLKKFIKEQLFSEGCVVKAAFNRLAYPSFRELKRRAEREGGITSCSYTFTEWVHTIDFKKDPAEVYARWGISNSLHVISMAHALIGLPKELSCQRAGRLDWHPSGAVFTGSGVSVDDIPFSYHADWLSAGRWSLTLMTRQNAYRLMPLEELYCCPKGKVVWDRIECPQEFPGVKQGVAEEIAALLEPAGEKAAKLPDLSETAEYISLAEKIFDYDRR
jgi:predicted dehydrogenase